MTYSIDAELMAAVRFAEQNSVGGMSITLVLHTYGLDVTLRRAASGHMDTWKKTVHYGRFESGVGEGAIRAIREGLHVCRVRVQED